MNDDKEHKGCDCGSCPGCGPQDDEKCDCGSEDCSECNPDSKDSEQ